ncbi:nitrate reductase subunit beta [Propionigenium maris DSM 9537]|uniref:Nitrate reductase subunit beta n=1 Tax=Propionigenium maris DSM 9537 TaxID=1123000 RepID=A0A9W6GL93_9FUSO|nr:FAD-dependent oxidoreductase [Propionigenium maris]GLI55647.1 nitrate reductase subunit beta [Propionigenium maris DSM 9537]
MRYVVLGASAAGINGAKEIRKIDREAEIILISRDEHVYSRCILHHYISDHRNVSELDFSDENFFERYNIQWKRGRDVVGVDSERREVHLDNGESVSYYKLLIATGASSFIPPVENLRSAKRVYGLRNLEDAERIREDAKDIKRACVIGAGLVGVDAVTGLMELGVEVNLVEMSDRILPLQLDKKASSRYEEMFRKRGVEFSFSSRAERLEVDADNNPVALHLEGGEKVPCDMVVVATGVRSNISFLEGTGVSTDRLGLVIDDRGRTNDPHIFGAGDVTGRNPIWPNAVKEAVVAANNMLGSEMVMDDFFSSKNTMNFMDLPTMSIGSVLPEEGDIVEVDEFQGIYKKIIHKEGRIKGALLQGDLSYSGVLTHLIKNRTDISKINKNIFEIDYSDFFRLKKNGEYSY